MFLEIVVSVYIISSDDVKEKLIDEELVDSFSEVRILNVFVFSESGESVDFDQNISFVENCLNHVKPWFSSEASLTDFENNVVLEKFSLSRSNIM